MKYLFIGGELDRQYLEIDKESLLKYGDLTEYRHTNDELYIRIQLRSVDDSSLLGGRVQIFAEATLSHADILNHIIHWLRLSRMQEN